MASGALGAGLGWARLGWAGRWAHLSWAALLSRWRLRILVGAGVGLPVWGGGKKKGVLGTAWNWAGSPRTRLMNIRN